MSSPNSSADTAAAIAMDVLFSSIKVATRLGSAFQYYSKVLNSQKSSKAVMSRAFDQRMKLNMFNTSLAMTSFPRPETLMIGLQNKPESLFKTADLTLT